MSSPEPTQPQQAPNRLRKGFGILAARGSPPGYQSIPVFPSSRSDSSSYSDPNEIPSPVIPIGHGSRLSPPAIASRKAQEAQGFHGTTGLNVVKKSRLSVLHSPGFYRTAETDGAPVKSPLSVASSGGGAGDANTKLLRRMVAAVEANRRELQLLRETFDKHPRATRAGESTSHSDAAASPPSLKPEDVGIFHPDGCEDEGIAALVFLSQIQDAEAVHSIASLVRVLPRCLRGRAVLWYATLGAEEKATHRHPNSGVEAFKSSFAARYTRPKTEAALAMHSRSMTPQEAQSLAGLQRYFDHKQLLLTEAGIASSKERLCEVWNGLPEHYRSASDFLTIRDVADLYRRVRLIHLLGNGGNFDAGETARLFHADW